MATSSLGQASRESVSRLPGRFSTMAKGNTNSVANRNDAPKIIVEDDVSTQQTCLRLNQAYMALEKVRRLNLFLSCQEHLYRFHSHQGGANSSTTSPPRFSLEEADYQACAACVLQAAQQGKYVASTTRRSGRNSTKTPHVFRSLTQQSSSSSLPQPPPPLSEESPSPGSPRPLLKWKSRSKLLHSRTTNSSNAAPPPPLHSFQPSNTADLGMQHQHDRCLTCGAPACAKHSSATFRKEADVVVCHECANVLQHFSSETTSASTTAAGVSSSSTGYSLQSSNHQQDKSSSLPSSNNNNDDDQDEVFVEKLIDLYDHAKLLLEFSLPFVPAIAQGLESEKTSHNKLKIGGSSVGIMSGVCGLAGLVLTTTTAVAVAPPLLIASVLFGTSATAVPLGTNVAARFFSQPNKLANRLLALYGIVLSVLVIVEQLQQENDDELEHQQDQTTTCLTTNGEEGLVEQFSTNVSVQQDESVGTFASASLHSIDTSSLLSFTHKKQPPYNSNGSAAASTMTSSSIVSGTMATITTNTTPPWAHLWHQNRTARQEDLSRSARLLTRTGLGAFLNTSLSFLSFTGGGALAGATIVLEAKALRLTLQAMEAGNPCEKASALQAIQQQATFPTTVQVERECRAYLQKKKKRRGAIVDDKAPMEMVVLTNVVVDSSCSLPCEKGLIEAPTTTNDDNVAAGGLLRFTDSVSACGGSSSLDEQDWFTTSSSSSCASSVNDDNKPLLMLV